MPVTHHRDQFLSDRSTHGTQTIHSEDLWRSESYKKAFISTTLADRTFLRVKKMNKSGEKALLCDVLLFRVNRMLKSVLFFLNIIVISAVSTYGTMIDKFVYISDNLLIMIMLCHTPFDSHHQVRQVAYQYHIALYPQYMQ